MLFKKSPICIAIILLQISVAVKASGNIILDFNDRLSGSKALMGIYGDINLGDPPLNLDTYYHKQWFGEEHYLLIASNSTAQQTRTFNLSSGKVLKSFKIASRGSSINRVEISSKGNPALTWNNIGGTWTTKTTGWVNTAQTVTVKITCSGEFWDVALDDIVCDEGVYNIGREKQVFIDDRFIKHPSNVVLSVNKPTLRKEKLIVSDRPWEAYRVGPFTSAIQKDNGDIELWYPYITNLNRSDSTSGIAYAISTDGGATFCKPNLKLVSFNNSNDNNIIEYGAITENNSCVFLLEPNFPDGFKYGMTIGEKGNNRLLISRDGKTFGNSTFPIPFIFGNDTQSLDSQNTIFWDNRIMKYVYYPRLFYSGSYGRCTGRYESSNLMGFHYFNNVAPIVLSDSSGLQIYNTAAIKYPYAQDAYFAFPSYLIEEDGPVDIRFAASRDGIKWIKPSGNIIINEGFKQNGDVVPYEQGSLYAGTGLTRNGDELSLYYTTFPNRHVLPDNTQIGIITRAIYKLDRFMFLKADEAIGEFITDKIIFEGNTLYINTEAAGWVKVEILDESGCSISGYSYADADQLTGDDIRKRVMWRNGNSNVSFLAGQIVRLKFTMQKAKLYSFQFNDEIPVGINNTFLGNLYFDIRSQGL